MPSALWMKAMSERHLVSIREVDRIDPIPNADAIEVLTIDGWQVVSKKGEFKVGDLCVFFEIDSIVPDTAPFKFLIDKQGKNFEKGFGARLRTIKLRGQISQGLALPLAQFPEITDEHIQCELGVGADAQLDELLGVYKYEPKIHASMAGQIKGNYPHWIPKTDQERIQNCYRSFESRGYFKSGFVVEEKLEGSSMTIYVNREGELGVTSRNMDLKLEQEGNAFVNAAKKSGLLEFLQQYHEMGKEVVPDEPPMIAIRGELIGPNIQGNIYGLTEHEFRVFDVYVGNFQRYMAFPERQLFIQLVESTGLEVKTAPIIGSVMLDGVDIESIINEADGQSAIAETAREGLVFKSLDVVDKHIPSFKSISKNYLLAEA